MNRRGFLGSVTAALLTPWKLFAKEPPPMPRGTFIIESTPCEGPNRFYEMWREATGDGVTDDRAALQHIADHERYMAARTPEVIAAEEREHEAHLEASREWDKRMSSTTFLDRMRKLPHGECR